MPFRNVACGTIDFVVLWSTNKDNNTFHHEWLACCAAVLQQALRCSTKSVRNCCFPSDSPIHLDHAWTEALSHALKRANVMFVHLFPLEENPETSNFSLATGMTTSTLLPCHTILDDVLPHTVDTPFRMVRAFFRGRHIKPAWRPRASSCVHGTGRASDSLRQLRWCGRSWCRWCNSHFLTMGGAKKARLDETRRSLTGSRQPATNHDEELHGQQSHVACEQKNIVYVHWRLVRLQASGTNSQMTENACTARLEESVATDGRWIRSV